jgi:hypothetical protein
MAAQDVPRSTIGSMSSPSLEGALLKLDQARQHIALVTAYTQQGPAVALTKAEVFDAEANTFRVGALVSEVPDLPKSWSLPVGDAVQNIRAALEYLVYELVALRADGVPYKWTTFPISTTGDFRPEEQETIDRLGEHWERIDKTQPYHAQADDAAGRAFGVLQKMSNQDKHRLLVPVAAAMEPLPAQPLIMATKDLTAPIKGGFNAGLLEKSTEIAWQEFHTTGPDPAAWVQSNYFPFIVSEHFPTLRVHELLQLVHRKAELLVQAFLPLF